MWSVEDGKGQDGVWIGVWSVGKHRMTCGGCEEAERCGESEEGEEGVELY